MEGRRSDTVANLACAFGVSIRTIKYDNEVLMAEYPIETRRGNKGCVYLPKDYREYKGSLTEEQQHVLIVLIATAKTDEARCLAEILRSHGSFRNKEKIEEAIKHSLQ